MRVFVTGATGHVGLPVVAELLQAGHDVVGLARSEASAHALLEAGADAERGSLDDLETLRRVAAGADGVIHLAYMHDAPSGSDPAASDVRAIDALGAGLAGSDKVFVGTSGTLVLGSGHTGTEQDPPDPEAPARARIDGETAALALADRGVRSSVVRLPPTVHSSLDHHGFIPTLIGIAREKNTSAYIGDGANRWPAVHTLDAARLFRLALERAAAGARWHASADEGIPFRDIADVIGHQLGVPVQSIPADQAQAHFGWLSFAATADNPVSSTQTRERLMWTPNRPGLIADLEQSHYFKA